MPTHPTGKPPRTRRLLLAGTGGNLDSSGPLWLAATAASHFEPTPPTTLAHRPATSGVRDGAGTATSIAARGRRRPPGTVDRCGVCQSELCHLAKGRRDANRPTAEVDRRSTTVDAHDSTQPVRVMADPVADRVLLDHRLGAGLEGAGRVIRTRVRRCGSHSRQYARRNPTRRPTPSALRTLTFPRRQQGWSPRAMSQCRLRRSAGRNPRTVRDSVSTSRRRHLERAAPRVSAAQVRTRHRRTRRTGPP